MHRLFAHFDIDEVKDPSCQPFRIGRVLEDGDSNDLAELVRELGETVLAEWLTEHGGRQLSNRSRAFWQILLDRTSEPSEAPDLWLL